MPRQADAGGAVGRDHAQLIRPVPHAVNDAVAAEHGRESRLARVLDERRGRRGVRVHREEPRGRGGAAGERTGVRRPDDHPPTGVHRPRHGEVGTHRGRGYELSLAGAVDADDEDAPLARHGPAEEHHPAVFPRRDVRPLHDVRDRDIRRGDVPSERRVFLGVGRDERIRDDASVQTRRGMRRRVQLGARPAPEDQAREHDPTTHGRHRTPPSPWLRPCWAGAPAAAPT